jgi:dihydroorotate dehydrogenase electron transfer subunit
MAKINSLIQAGTVVYNKPTGAKDCFRMGLLVKTPIIGPLPGQFIHLKLTKSNETLLRRPFSIYNVTNKNTIEIVYQVVGKGTRLMSGMKAGTKMDVMGPLGNGFSINKKARHSILVAGGIGSSGLHLLLKNLATLKGKHEIYNLIGARTKKELYIGDSFKHPLTELRIATDDGSKGVKGFVTDLLEKLLNQLQAPPKQIQVYACGPEGMTHRVCEIAKQYKIPCQVSLEEWMGCGIGICRACVCKVRPRSCRGTPYRPAEQSGAGKEGASFRYAPVCSEGPVFEAAQLSY